MKLPGIVQFRKCTLTDQQLAEAVAEGLGKMYETGKVPARNIPAKPDDDFDLLLGELIVRFMEREGALPKLKAELHAGLSNLAFIIGAVKNGDDLRTFETFIDESVIPTAKRMRELLAALEPQTKSE